MIKSFRHKGLEEFYLKGKVKLDYQVFEIFITHLAFEVLLYQHHAYVLRNF